MASNNQRANHRGKTFAYIWNRPIRCERGRQERGNPTFQVRVWSFIVSSGHASLSQTFWQVFCRTIIGELCRVFLRGRSLMSFRIFVVRPCCALTAIGLMGCAGSTRSTVQVRALPPSITTQPASETVTAGQSATFTVTASGTAPLSYQWQKNHSDITGATSSSYTTPATTTADNNSTFDVVVTNSAGSMTSNTATLTVNPSAVPPSIKIGRASCRERV